MDSRQYDAETSHIYQKKDYYSGRVEGKGQNSYQYNELYDNDNMEWDSTFEERDYQPAHSRVTQYEERDVAGVSQYNDYNRDSYYDRYNDERRYRREYHDYDGKKQRERGRCDIGERDTERGMERFRYSDRSERGERERERDRSWDHSSTGRPRDRERDRSWERSKDRGRERDRDRDRDRDPYRERGKDRERELYRERDRDRDRRRDDRSDRDRNVDERYARDRKRTSVDRDVNKEKLAPSAHIMIRGSPSKLNREDEIAGELQQKGLEYQDIKIIRNRHGESRGFGFVDFYDVATAEKWMSLTKGIFYVGESCFSLEYSKTRAAPLAYHQMDVDWYCSKCRTLNYASRKRVTCFSCGEHRKDYPPEGQDDNDYDENGQSKDAPISAPPCNVLMMRGLDTNTSEETIRNHLVELTSVPIFDVRLIKDKVTGISRGFCFIELGSTEDAKSLLENIQQCDPAYFIEGRRVSVGYARNTPHPPVSKVKHGSEAKQNVGSSLSQGTKNVNIASIAIAQAQAAQLQGQSANYNTQVLQQQQIQASLILIVEQK